MNTCCSIFPRLTFVVGEVSGLFCYVYVPFDIGSVRTLRIISSDDEQILFGNKAVKGFISKEVRDRV